jgi:hypothetical protein
MLSDRYRIVALLGTGGMGEVYRADDTKLGQPVALKFLPRSMRDDLSRIERLYSEVRLGRQVSHPNVCRLYDVGEWEGNHFLAMEYVDGEDLASLIRRIGKLPNEKALEIVREICAGIAAAHALGIVHRDLKPANIMLDGRGHVRVTDFGLAVVAEDLAERREIAGTPAYMAPEQLSGGRVTDKSDLYALGLILFEIFTGRKLFDGISAADPASRRSALRTLTASGDSRDLDPVMQRVIARCVEEAPEARPASIHSVIAALPGGDALQAAIEAGETPSPQMVAAAGEVGDLKPLVAWSILALAVVAFIGVALLFPKTVLIRMVPLEKPPEALIERAREMLAAGGHVGGVRDTAHAIQTDDDFLRKMARRGFSLKEQQGIADIRPGVLFFSYRESPIPLVAGSVQGKVTDKDPPVTEPGMRHVTLDAKGRLMSLVAVPQERASGKPQAPVDWSKFFAFAGGDIDGLREVPANWTAPVDADEKKSWEGHYRDVPGQKIRIEAGSFDGKPVWFRIAGPWSPPRAAEVWRGGYGGDDFGATIFQVVNGLVLILAAIIARRNLRRSRGDRKTAMRLAIAMFTVYVIGHLLRVDHVTIPGDERDLLERGVANGLLVAAETFVLYLALEPLVRRRWPHTLIGWTRLFSGRYRDPMIGRDLLVGTCTGILMALVLLTMVIAPSLFGRPMLAPLADWASPLLGLRHLIFSWVVSLMRGVPLALFLVLLLPLALMLLRRRNLAVVAIWILFSLFAVGTHPLHLALPFAAVAAGLFIFVMLRYGVLAAAIAAFVMGAIGAAPLTFDPDSWFFSRSMAFIVLLAVMLVYGFISSLGEKSPFSIPVLDEA